MDAYRKGTSGRLADFINKNSKAIVVYRHRCVANSWQTMVQSEYFNKYNEKAETCIQCTGEVFAIVESRVPGVSSSVYASLLAPSVEGSSSSVNGSESPTTTFSLLHVTVNAPFVLAPDVSTL